MSPHPIFWKTILVFQAIHVGVKLKQKVARELVEAFQLTQHEENQCIGQPSLVLHANEIKFLEKWGGVTNQQPPPVLYRADIEARASLFGELPLESVKMCFLCVLFS